jgi:hypothetical protein
MTSTTATQPLQQVTDQLFDIAMAAQKIDRDLADSLWSLRDRTRTAAMNEREAIAQRARVDKRIIEVHQYIQRMRAERVGFGPDAMREADETAASFLDGLTTLLAAEQMWVDGLGLSFGGVMAGGIVFGLIASQRQPCLDHFTTPPLTFTFHS